MSFSLRAIIGIVAVAGIALGGCTNTAPSEVKDVVIEKVVHDPENYFGGCFDVHRDCKETHIVQSYEVNPLDLPATYQAVDAAWCVQWSIRIRHPINNNYDSENGWAVVLRKGTDYTPLPAPNGMLTEEKVLCQ